MTRVRKHVRAGGPQRARVGQWSGPRCLLRHARSGVTLVELMVTLALLGILTGVVGLAAGGARSVRRAEDPAANLAEARREALRRARAVRITVVEAGVSYSATAFPDGSVVADTVFHADRLTGKTGVPR